MQEDTQIMVDAPSDSDFKKLKECSLFLKKEMERLGASSYTLYVQDPWASELRLVSMYGVIHPEPLYGFSFPERDEPSPENCNVEANFYPNAIEEAVLRSSQSRPVRDLVDKKGAKLFGKKGAKLFGSFIEREGILSCARFRQFAAGRVECILYVNFNRKTEFDTDHKDDLGGVFTRLSLDIEDIIHELESSDSVDSPLDTPQLLRIIKPIDLLATIDQSPELERDSSELEANVLGEFFDHLLEATLDALELNQQDNLGTVHLFEPTRGKLTLVASRGPAGLKPSRTKNAFNGDGVISWVALRKRPILIKNLPKSSFSGEGIYRENGIDGISSVIAVPLMVGSNVLGVLNLESKEFGKFSARTVRTLWFAAKQATLAFRFRDEMSKSISATKRATESTELIQDLLVLSHKAATENFGTSDSMDELAALIRRVMESTRCELWAAATKGEAELSQIGSSSSDAVSEVTPRKNGWTRFIFESKVPVRLFRSSNATGFGCEYWTDLRGGAWQKKLPANIKTKVPKKLNPESQNSQCRCELGLPVLIGDTVIGVLWLKYRTGKLGKLSSDRMKMALGFAGRAAFVIDSVGRLQKQNRQRASSEKQEDFQNHLFPGGNFNTPCIEGFVISRPCDKMGGDFYDIVEIDGTTSGILLGDAEGHGETAALMMLPMFTAFKLSYNDCYSPHHTLSKIYQVAHEFELRGTATYFVVGVIHGQPWLLASSAGHEPIMIKRQSAPVFRSPGKHGPASSLMLGATSTPFLSEDRVKIEKDDIIIAFSDGLIEAKPEGTSNLFGIDRVEKFLEDCTHESPEEIAKALLAAAQEHQGSKLFSDDLTIIVARVV